MNWISKTLRQRLIGLTLCGLVPTCLPLTTLAQEAAVAEPPTKAEVESGSGEEESDAVTKDTKSPEFVRVDKEGKQLRSLQTAVVTYRTPGDPDGVEVALIGAIHIAEPEYYSRLNQLFASYEALLYELVSDPDAGVPDPEERGLSPISSIQVGMKEALELSFQLDEIDYKAKNFVHADMTPEEFFESLESRKEGLMQMFFRSMGAGLAMQGAGRGGSDMQLFAALMADNRGKALRRAFADQMGQMDGQMAALTGDDGKSTLITERNAKAFEVLEREIEAGKKKLGVFYGAGHLKDMHERLIKDFGLEPVKTEWLDAWDLK